MWLTFAVILVALVMYTLERLTFELTSLGVICVLLVFFHFVPVVDADGHNILNPTRLLAGFANPALLTVVALLVMGEGLARTGVLEAGAQMFFRYGRGHAALATGLAFVAVLVVSGFMNNTPVVVIFIPIMQALASRLGQSPSRLMMPLSFAAILGGMVTLIGSSTNLLVSGMLIELGNEGFSFFQFALPGAALALVGVVYVIFVCPRLLPERALLTNAIAGGGRQFMAEVAVTEDSKFHGMQPRGGFFPDLKDMTVRVIIHEGESFMPPFDDAFRLSDGDILVVAATRAALTEALKGEPEQFHPELGQDWERFEGEDGAQRWQVGNQVLAEAMVTPASRLVGQTLTQIGFRYQYHCVVLGIQRRSQMIRARVTEIRLEPGDVLLMQGRESDVESLRGNQDILLVEWTAAEMPAVHHATSTLVIFAAVIGSAALGLVPIEIATLVGAGAMLATGVLNIRQAARAIDRTIVMMIAAALALGSALQATGGAEFLAGLLLSAVGDASPAVILSAFFLLVAVLANIISTKATAVLFTPIAVGLANGLALPIEPFAVAVVFAANCSFASPVGYQTNLLVMAPGNYRFVDFVRVGTPLLIIVWLIFSLVAPWYYGLI
ncbi:MAG: SLC13 family permease [Rhodospirillaceae bacterium]|nr:SLC13 family permease [Rhodospirillaceae bacterium]MBT5943609.1 SLC13 family permease [Rhodospirillaceae bacterium]MBT6405947.1 SLC13 family permease [Rhodospirillaceae bacterium]MBT6535885.1 SLC13 family permease [Rhodospirillaceae bacterium]MBT7362727.1 SLC13 family permease [Rhodospirillaceae bacterium]